MTVDVDAVNERLNGLVNLLHVVGIDGVDPDALVEEQKRLAAQKKTEAVPESRPSSDVQILEIIKKLQQAQADSPEILAALKSPELRALASLAAQKQSKPEPVKKAAPSLDDVMDDDDNYPKIGPGYSDDISVVSDLTTPTVMTRQQVAEEEYYRDVNGGPGGLPPMHIGVGAGQPSRPKNHVHPGAAQGHVHAPKTKNLVSQVRPGATRRAIAKSGGAAAQRRLNYQQAMAKLQSNEYGTPVASKKKDKSYMDGFSPKKPAASFFPTSPTPTKDPSQFPSIAEAKKARSTRNKVNPKKGRKTALAAQEVADIEFDVDPNAPPTAPPTTPSVTRTPGSNSKKKNREKDRSKDKSRDLDWNTSGDNGGWPSFEGSQSKNAFDNDGFFADGFGGSDPFSASQAKTSRSRSPKPEKKVTRDDGQSESKSRRPKNDNEWAAEKQNRKERSKKGKSRRASLSM